MALRSQPQHHRTRSHLCTVVAACTLAFAAGAWAQPASESKPLGRDSASLENPSDRVTATPSSVGGTIVKTVVSLGGVLAIIVGVGVGAKYLVRKGVLPTSLGAGARSPSGVLEVLARYPAGGGLTLVVIKFDRRVLLVSQSAGKGLRRGGGSMTPLCELSQPEDVASVLLRVRGEDQAAMARSFQAMLAQEDDQAERVVSQRALPENGATVVRTHERSRAKPTTARSQQQPTGRDAAIAIRSRLASLRQQPDSAQVRTVLGDANSGRGVIA